MNEKALETLYSLAKKDGYNKSLEEFKTLMKTNGDAVNKMYSLAQSDGYSKKKEDFNTLVGFESTQKKNSNSPLSSGLDSENSQGSPSDGGQDGSPTESDLDATSAKESRVLSINSTRELAGSLQGWDEEISRYQDFYNEEKRVEDPFSTDNTFEIEYTPAGQEGFVSFSQAGGVGEESQSEVEKEVDIRKRERELFQSGANTLEVIDFGNKERGHYESMNDLYSKALPEEQDSLFMEDEETGLTKLNPVAYAKYSVKLEEVLEDDERRLAQEMDKLSEKNELQEIGYDLWTGTRSIGYGFMGLWNPEQAQYNLYQDQARTQASYKIEGLTDEEIEKGLFKNLSEGNWNAFTTMFGTQLAQTAPQLAMQSAIAAGTGGLGLSASTAMWASSAVMGLQTFGSTSANYYGLVDDNKRYMMAFGDALVETLSERAFPDDMMALTKKKYKGVSLDNIRRDFFKKGLMTKEFRKMAAQHAQRTGIQVLESGLEEGMEEALAGIGSQFIHSMVNDEEMNMFEVIDGMIVGFGAGAKSRGFRAANETITATASSLGFGGIRNNLIKVKGQKQKLAKELQRTTDEVRKAQIESKLKSLTKIELNMKRDMNDVYSEYSDEDAENTIKQNQKFQNAMLKYKKAEGKEAKDAARAEAKVALKQIQSIEAKYEGQVKSVQEQREAVKTYDYGESGTLDISEDTDTKGIKILEGLKNIKKALGKDAKVQVHDSYESMAKALKVDKSKVEDSAGIYNGKDGSIHVFLPAAMENTSYHEAFHKIAETVDSKYRKKFVDAAIAGMSDELAQKYKDFGQQYKGDNKLMYEEMFVEMLADVSTGAISIDNVGTSVASMAMGEVFKIIQKAGFLKKKTLPTFKDFVSFLETEADNLRNGTELKRDKTWSPKNPRKAVSFFKQLKQDSENNKRPIQQSMSEHEILGDNWSMENSTITDKMQMNKNGNFVFSHVSNKKLDNVDPQYFGKNHLTSSEERREVGLAGVSLSMYGVNPNDIDVAGEYTYMVEINPNEVYNAVDDPKGLVAKAKTQLKEEGKAASDNTVFALASKMAAKEGYKMVVTPWTKTKVRAQTVSKLDVVPYVEFDPVKLYDIETEVVPPIDTRKAVNAQAKSILNAVKGVIPSSLYMRLDKMSYSALDGRFGAVNNLDEYVELLETALDEVDLSNPNSDVASSFLTNAISEAFRFADSKGYTRRVQSEEARKKTIEKVQNEIANKSEGFTIDPITGEFMTEGVAVGDAKGEVSVGFEDAVMVGIGTEVIEKVIERALSNPIAAIGGWFNSENGQFYLDVSEVYDNRETAVRLGKKRKEFGVFDMSTGDYIPTATEEDHDNRDSNDLKKQKILDDRSEVEKFTEMMNSMPDAHVEWVEPVGTASVIVDPIKSNPNKVTKAILKALGYKSVSDLTKPTSAFNGIPSIPAMSDILGSGEMKDANGNPMSVNGGITTGLFGSSFKDGVAWCGVTRHDAEVQLNDALNVYNANKPYFEKIWADETNPIPYGHVPMVIMRMSDTAVNSNEAVFRYISPYIKNFPKQNRINAFNAFKARVEADKAWLDEKLERHEQGLPMMDKRTRTVKDPSKKQEGLQKLEMNQIKSQERLLKFFEKHNITTLDQLMDLIAEDSHKRARAAVDKTSSEQFIQLTDKEYITSILFRVHADTKSGYKTRSKPNEIVKELFGEQEGDAEKFTFHNVTEAIAEPSMRDVKANHAVAVMGVDVLNPAVIETTHENYGFGPKGRFIAVLSDPRHGADIFPEWEVKLSRMATSGTKTKDSRILSSVGSTFFGDKVFRGSAIQTESSKEVDTIIAKMRHAFPFVHLAKSQESFEETANQEGTETVTSPDGVVLYALTKDGVIVLNPSIDTVNAAVGQFGHVWLKFLSEGASKFGRDLLAKGMKLAEETDLYEQNLEKRNGDKKAAAMDTLAQLIGNKGSNIQEAAKQSKFKSWMKGLYELIRTNFKVIFSRDSDDKMRMNRNEKKEFFERMTLDNFLDLSVAELFQGKQVKSEYRPSPVEQTSSQLKKQKTQAYIEVAQQIRDNVSKKDIIAELVERGYSKKDANSLYQKAAGYKIGNNAGYRQGVKERNEAYREARKKQLAEERLEAKFLRQRAKEIFKKEKRVTDAMIKEISDYLKDKKINIKASQLKTILRLMNAAHRNVGKKTDPNHQYAVFTSFVDAVAKIIDKQMDAKQIEEHANLLRKVNKQQSKLKNKIKNMSKASKSPLTSYIKQVDNLISLDGGVLTYESLERLSNALSSLEVTVKSVSVRKNKDGEKVLGNPYFEVEGEMVNGRRAKMYFDEVFNELKNEEIQRTEERMIELAMDKAYEEGTDWYTAYQELLRKKMEKELKPMEKKLKAIADDLGLDLDNVDDMETAFEIYEEEKREDEEQTKSIIINDAILPVVQTHLSLLLSNSDFQDILGWNPDLPYETNMDNVKARLNELRLSELKRLEFFTYDHLANGKTYGLKALSAVVRAKNDGNAKLNKLNMKASAAKGLRGGYFSLMENTPTFFRRIFKQYSQGKVAEYMNAIGFGNIRKNVAQAEARHEAFVGRVRTKLGELNMLSSSAQMQMQLYSLFRQKPEGVTDAAWVVYVKNSIELALAEDTRISDKQRSEIEAALAVLKDGRRSRSLSQIVEQLEQIEGLVEAVEYLEMEFAAQEPKVKEYAENFLGMHFKEESNYLPMMFRAVGSKASEVDELIQKVENVGKAMASHNLTRANSQASSTYERNANAIKTQKRYIDLNFLSAIEKTYKENEIKTATAEDVAYISVMTSEKNDSFVDSVDDKDIRAAIRKKVYNYLVNASDYQQADEILGKHGAKAAKYAMNITVVAYFGATIEQLLKQGSAMANALFETRSMAARMIYFNTLGDLRGAIIGKGIDSSLPYAGLINKFPIGNRNITTEVLMVGAEAKIGEKGRIEKGVEKSTTFLRGTDEMVATATWLAYYADYLISEQGVDPKDIDWAKESENPNDNAAMFAEQMTVKDQNISSRRDKSRINEIMRGQLMQVVKMVAMPFANFLFNKKLNLALDMQKAFVGDKKAKGEAIRSLAGTVAEVYAFQAAAWAILSPMYAAIGSALFGADDEEEESWWDKKFGNQMIKRGMYLDLNPLVVPVAAMEHWFLHLSNMAQYGLTQDQDDWRYADENWSKGFERWERMNGMPIFKGAGRDDFSSKDFFSMLGVTGNVAYDITNTMSNIKTLSDKTPSYTTSTGQKKYISTKDADKMLLIETGRLTLLGIMAGTGLHSKELSKILKEGKKPMERRAEADIERWIGNEIMAGNEVGLDEMIDYLNTEIEGDPTNAMSKIDSIIKKAKGSTEVMESLVSKENINTMRVIDKSEASNRGRAIMIHHIAKDMSPEEAKQFVLDSYLYFGIKYGVETVKSQAIADILKFGNNE